MGDLRVLLEQVDAARDAEGLEERLIHRKVAVEKALVVLEDVYAHAVKLRGDEVQTGGDQQGISAAIRRARGRCLHLHEEDGKHRDDNRFALAGGHLGDERAQVELRL